MRGLADAEVFTLTRVGDFYAISYAPHRLSSILPIFNFAFCSSAAFTSFCLSVCLSYSLQQITLVIGASPYRYEIVTFVAFVFLIFKTRFF